MKLLSKEELQDNATRLMKAQGKTQIFATQNGNYFFGHHDAINHNAGLKAANKDTGWDGEVISFNMAPPPPEGGIEEAAKIEEPVTVDEPVKEVKAGKQKKK